MKLVMAKPVSLSRQSSPVIGSGWGILDPLLRTTTVRFSDAAWAGLVADGERSGMSAAELVREAVTLRLAFAAAQASIEDPRGILWVRRGHCRRRGSMLRLGAFQQEYQHVR